MNYKCLLLIIFMLIFFSCDDEGSNDEFEISIPVSVNDVKLGSIKEYVTTSATLDAIKKIALKSETSGKYRLAVNPKTGIKFASGDPVKKGEVIIYLDNPELENTTKIESQKLTLNISQQEYEKQQSLYKKGGVTLLELRNSERSFKDAQYNYDNAVIQLQKLQFVAPFNGKIVRLPYYTPETKIEPNQVMVEIMDYSKLYAEVQFASKELTRIELNQAVQITHHNLPEDTLLGVIQQVSPALDPSTHSFAASLLIDNPDKKFRPGMYVQVDAIVAEKESTIVIPKEIILAKRKGKTVYIVDKGAAIERVITTGLENVQEVEVLEGIKENERLVVKGFETLRNKSKVKIVK